MRSRAKVDKQINLEKERKMWFSYKYSLKKDDNDFLKENDKVTSVKEQQDV